MDNPDIIGRVSFVTEVLEWNLQNAAFDLGRIYGKAKQRIDRADISRLHFVLRLYFRIEFQNSFT
jgi:hypothetical protein